MRRYFPLMTARRVAVGIVAVMGVAAGIVWLASAWHASRLPGSYNVMDYGVHDYGGRPGSSAHARHDGTSVPELHGTRAGRPDVRFVLTAQRSTIRLASGYSFAGLTFNGRSPGPELLPASLARNEHRRPVGERRFANPS